MITCFVHWQTDQRVCEWRSGFASAALSILHAFFDDNDFDSDDSRQEFAKSSLQGLSFLFRDVYTNRKGDVSELPTSSPSGGDVDFFRLFARVSSVDLWLFKLSQCTLVRSKMRQVYQVLGTQQADLPSHLLFLLLLYATR